MEKIAKRTSSSASLLLGDLLIKANLIGRQEFADALPISLKTGLPVGRILIGSGQVKEKTMQAVLFAQSLVRDRLLDEETAVKAIVMVNEETCDWEMALKNLGWKSESYEQTNRLGELFLEAGLITDAQLQGGLDAFFSTGLPLARVLVLQGIIDTHIAFAALTAQKLVRDGAITRPQAIAALRSAKVNNTTLEDSLGYNGIVGPEPVNVIRLGELLALANAVSDIDLIDGVERSIKNNELIGETMVTTGHLSKYLLDAALELQKMATIGKIEPSAAGSALRRIYTTGITVDEALEELESPAATRRKLLGLEESGVPSHARSRKTGNHKLPKAQDNTNIAAQELSKTREIDIIAPQDLTKTRELDIVRPRNKNAEAAQVEPKDLQKTMELDIAMVPNLKGPADKNESGDEFVPAEELAILLGIPYKAVVKRLKKGAISGIQRNGKWFGKYEEENLSDEENAKIDFLEQTILSHPGAQKDEAGKASANKGRKGQEEELLAKASEVIDNIWQKRKSQASSEDKVVVEILSEHSDNNEFLQKSSHSADLLGGSGGRGGSGEKPSRNLMDLGKILANEMLAQPIPPDAMEKMGGLQYNIPFGYELNATGELSPRKNKSTSKKKYRFPRMGKSRSSDNAAQMAFLDKLLSRIEELSHRNGYLEGKLEALTNGQLEGAPLQKARVHAPKRKVINVTCEQDLDEAEWID